MRAEIPFPGIFFRMPGYDHAPSRNTVPKMHCAGEKEHLAIDDKFEHDIDNIIEVGKEKGYLTYGDVNDMLPEDVNAPDDLDDLIGTINTQGIDLLDAPKFPGD